MLKLSLLEFVLRVIPEEILYVVSICVFSNKKVCFKKTLISGFLLGVGLFFIRKLPIQFGIHTFLFLVMLILVSIWINKIRVHRAITSSLISVMILSTCDWISYFIMTDVLKRNVKEIMKNPLLKVIYGLPSLILFAIIILIFSRYGKVLKNVLSRKNS